MVPGTLGLLCMASLAVLIRTGWFHGLEEQFGMARRTLLFGLLVQIALAGTVLRVTPLLELHPGVVLLLPFLVRLLTKTEEGELFAVSSTLFFAGALYFLAKEWFWADPPDWSIPWPLLTGVTLAGLAAAGSLRLHDRAAVWIGGTLLGEGLSMILHRGETSPLRFGNESMRDFLWSGLTGLVLFHCARQWTAARLRRALISSHDKGKE